MAKWDQESYIGSPGGRWAFVLYGGYMTEHFCIGEPCIICNHYEFEKIKGNLPITLPPGVTEDKLHKLVKLVQTKVREQ